MARSPTTLDAFSAIAEPRRREVLDVLAKGEQPVTDLVESLGWPQPVVSKHLGVLRQVGLVSVERKGRQRMYSVNGEQLKPVFNWIKEYERFWTHQLNRIKERAERAAAARANQPSSKEPRS